MCRNQAFFICAINSRSKQTKKKTNLEHLFVDIGKKVTYIKFQQKILKSMVVRACESFQFFRQKAWFLKNNRALPNFL